MELSNNFKKFMGMEKSPSEQFTERFKPTPIDPRQDAIESMSISDIVPEAVKHVTGSEVAALASSVVSPSSSVKRGIMMGKVGLEKLKSLGKEIPTFESKYFGTRGEVNPPQSTIDLFTSGEIDKRLQKITETKTNLENQFAKILDQVPKEAFRKDFSIDYEKVPKTISSKLKRAEEAVQNYQVKIKDIIKPEEFDDLYKAYPDIFDYNLSVRNNPMTNVGGSYLAEGKRGSFQINKAKLKDNDAGTAEVLFHELQHAVQHFEYIKSYPERSFNIDYLKEQKKLKTLGSKNPKDISWEAEAYDSGLRDAYPDLRFMPIETKK